MTADPTSRTPDQHRKAGHSPPPLGYVVKATLLVILTVGLAAVAYEVRQVLLLVAVSLVLAIGLEPVVHKMGRWVGRRTAVAVVAGSVVVTVAVVVAVLAPAIVSEARGLAAEMPGYVEDFSDSTGLLQDVDSREDASRELRSFAEQAPGSLGTSLDALVGVTKGVATFVASTALVFVFTIYLLYDLPRLRSRGRRLVQQLAGDRWARALDDGIASVAAFVTGRLVVSVIAGVVSFVVLTILGVPHAAALAAWIALTDTVPVVGAVVGAVLAVGVAATESIVVAVVLVVFFLVYQHVENYLLVPKIIGRAVRLSSVVTLIAVLAGAKLAGILGALLALPVAAVIKVLIAELLRPQETGELTRE